MSLDENVRLMEQSLRNSDIFVLIWGPGSKSREGYNKREKIRADIKEHFPVADVYFSEDKELNEKFPFSEYLEPDQKELFHLDACDICIVLNVSSGPATEIAIFARSPYAFKMFILTPEKNRDKDRDGFSEIVKKRLNEHFFSPDEWQSCNLTRRALAQAKYAALDKMKKKRA